MYKALNTFIDDLFAFIIKMPTLHRLSCFRDGAIACPYNCLLTARTDLVFVIYLYQRWKYPVDKTRANEVRFDCIWLESLMCFSMVKLLLKLLMLMLMPLLLQIR